MSEKIDIILNNLKALTLLETCELVEKIEKIFNIDTSTVFSNVKAEISPILSTSKDAPEKIEEKKSFDITLVEVSNDKKIAVLKIIRNITSLGLRECKDIVDNVPRLIKDNVTLEESEKIKKEIEEAGGKVSIK